MTAEANRSTRRAGANGEAAKMYSGAGIHRHVSAGAGFFRNGMKA